MIKVLRYLCILVFLTSNQSACRDVLLEFKAAAFIPTNSCVQALYGKAGALYGPEVTFQLCENKHWYGFASVDFLSKKGHSLGLCNPTTMFIVPVGLGVKYCVPWYCGDFYLGLGLQPVHLKTVNCSPDVVQTTSQWGVGGIAKVGTYVDLPSNWFVDFFFDYSFVKVGCDNCSDLVQSLRATLNGAIIGAGLGYRFN